ncbi:MAG TPA: SpvB/TcaC N-terminal domain-containing protein, partial [Polyangiaceae bacterium]|nr:SpvB/TcaC N-terminal domain-containing protein [Polyangiaceae bacterium]
MRRGSRTLAPVVLFLGCVFLHGGCTCADNNPLPPQPGVIACLPQHPGRPAIVPSTSEIATAAVGTIPVTFSTTSAGEASLVMPLRTVPGRGVEPSISLTYSSSGGNGVVGMGFSITGGSAILRCPSTLIDGEIRDVRYDNLDKLCLDGRAMVVVGKGPGRIEYRTRPDTHTRIIGHDPDNDGVPRSFEVFTPSGLRIEYGTTEGTRPRGPGGVPRAYLAAVTRDARGNSMDFAYCFADAGEYTAEYALQEIRYTGFEGSPALEPLRAARFVYGTKAPADIRVHYARGMALQSSLLLSEVQMIGPGEELVRRYPFTYELSPTTSRTLLTQVEECSGDVCKPPTRFSYRSDEPGFQERVTSISAPTSRRASPMLFDVDSDGLDDLVLPDTHPALSTPGNPVTQWFAAHNDGANASAGYLGSTKLAFLQEGILVADPTGAADPTLIQPELGSVIDYDGDGRRDILLHDVYGVATTWHVLLAQPDHTFKPHDTEIRRPFPLGAPPLPPTLNSRGGAMHLLDANGDRVPDLVQCEDHGATADVIPTESVWHIHLWRPARGEQPAGFDPEGERIDALGGIRCDAPFLTVDINADSKIDVLVQPVVTGGDGTQVPVTRYDAITRLEDGSWEVTRTNLPVVGSGGRVVFVDVNSDGLPDAVESGFQDHALRTYMNTGRGFAKMPVLSLGSAGLDDQDL